MSERLHICSALERYGSMSALLMLIQVVIENLEEPRDNRWLWDESMNISSAVVQLVRTIPNSRIVESCSPAGATKQAACKILLQICRYRAGKLEHTSVRHRYG